jgi:hypothetical protein
MGGAAGAAQGTCTPAFAAPNKFYTSNNGPQRGQTTTARYYWAESEGSSTYLHYTQSATPQNQKYSFLLATNTEFWDARVGDGMLLSIRADNTNMLVAYDPDQGTELGRRSTLDIGPIDVDKATAHYFFAPSGATPAIMRWAPPLSPTSAVSLSDLMPSDADLIGYLRVAGSRFVMATSRRVWLVDPGQATPMQLLFTTTADIDDLLVSPMTDAVLVRVNDIDFHMTGRDLYSALKLGTPLDLQKAIDALPAPPGCPPQSHHYAGAGTVYRDHYVYQAEGGIYAVLLTPTGPTTPTRLTDLLLEWPQVVADGSLFAVRFEGFDWYYYRVGQLSF